MIARAALAALLSTAALAAASPEDAVRRAAVAASPRGTMYRVGLDVAHRLMLSSERPYRLIDPATDKPVWADVYSGEIALIAQGGPEEDPETIYRIQVGSFASSEAAEVERSKLEKTTGAPAVVRWLPDRASFRVRVGEARSRAALAPLLSKLRDAGYKGVWIADEPAAAPSGITIRVVDASWNSSETHVTRLYAVPTQGALLKLQGKTYRGVIEIRVDGSGRLRAIDWVDLETYLRGVVPSELGPEVWPQLAALKAQAVAARTYALANRSQFEEEGFDICATPRCQAYGGASAEHPLSDRAVRETDGEIATWEGKPINALYTATCGGHTEDVQEIFPEQSAPYLSGVACRAEDEALSRTRRLLGGAPPVPVMTESGEDVTRDAALLAAAGVFGSRALPAMAKILDRPVDADALRAWTSVVARLAGRPAPSGKAIAPASLGRAALALTQDLGWSERTQVLLSDADLAGVLRDPRAASLPEDQRRALAYLAQQGVLHPAADGGWALDKAPWGATLVGALARMGDDYKIFDLEEASIAATGGTTLSIVRGQGSAALALAASPRLFTAAGTKTFPVAQLQLWPGDRIRYHLDREGRVDLLELRPPVKGLSDDRSAAVYSWEVRKTGAELQDAIDRRLAVGRLLDLHVERRGKSGRIVELKVVGSSGTAVVKGFDVRNLLDLRESLTVIELQKDALGGIGSAVFAGKGWGHGVGLCQVGAYGMAMRGADYKAILAHYYPGTDVTVAKPEPAATGAP